MLFFRKKKAEPSDTERRDFGDVLCEAIGEGSVVEIRLATGEVLKVKVYTADTFSMVGYFQVRGTSAFEGALTTINTDQIISFRVV